jgi:hypothetical protein
MNYGNMIANGFWSKDEALEFIRLAASNLSVLRMPLPQIIQ